MKLLGSLPLRTGDRRTGLEPISYGIPPGARRGLAPLGVKTEAGKLVLEMNRGGGERLMSEPSRLLRPGAAPILGLIARFRYQVDSPVAFSRLADG